MKLIGTLLIITGCFVAIDALWLGLVAPGFYKKYMGGLMTDKPNLLAAALFYVIFIAGLQYFVLRPLAATGQLLTIFLTGAFFGLVTYATYDLTNLATLKNWPLTVTVVDLVWGTILSGSVSTIATLVLRNLKLV